MEASKSQQQAKRVRYTSTYYSGQQHGWCATTCEATKVAGRFEDQVAVAHVKDYPSSASAKRAAIAASIATPRSAS